MLQDLRFGLKLLWKEKAFSLAALLTLALCIGANTAIFTVLHTVVLADLPFREPDRLVMLDNIYPGVGVNEGGANAIPDYLDRRKLTDVFSGVALIGGAGYDVGFEGSPKRIDGDYVTPSFFRVLAVEPIRGRAFTEEEAVLGKDKVAILSEGLWQEMYARDPAIIGKDIRLSGVPYRIVGVMPAGFGRIGRDAKIWVPFAFTPEQTSDDARHSNSWEMIARMRPGVSIAQVQQRINALNAANLERFPKFRAILISARFATRVVGWKEELVRTIRPTLYLLQAAVGFLLLIGCVNLANLMLVRSNVRMKELAIRFSLGAGRWRLGRQLLTESLTLSVVGGLLGILVGYVGVRMLAYLGANDLPRGTELHVNATVLAFTLGVAVTTGLVFGSVPLINLLRRNLNDVFRQNERTGSAGHRNLSLRSALVVCQVSLAFVLLIGSGLLTLSFAKLFSVDPGFKSEHVLSAQFSLPGSRYKDDAPARNFITTLLEKIRATPGVKQAGATTYLPFGGNQNASVIMIDRYTLAPGENPPVPGWNHIDSGYFQAMGIPLKSGRGFAESDSPEGQRVAVIDEFLARKYWPKGNPLGHKIRRGLESKDPLCTIVGVVGSVKTSDLTDQNPRGQVYYYYKQYVPRNMHVVVKTDNDNPQVASTLRREILQADAELPLFDIKTMPERISASLVNRRAAMILCLVFAGLALLLSAIGIYGVLAYTVAQRTREFGIRVALGAGSADVVGMVLRQGLRLAGVGLLIGAAGALALTRLMTTMLYDVTPTDPIVFAVVAATLGAVAAVAALIPSLRAVRIRPAIALRYE